MIASTLIFESCMGDFVVGSRVHTRDGHAVGLVSSWVAYPPAVGSPWGMAVVKGKPGARTSYLVDLTGALFDGAEISVPHDATTVRATSCPSSAARNLTSDEAGQVHRRYHAPAAHVKPTGSA